MWKAAALMAAGILGFGATGAAARAAEPEGRHQYVKIRNWMVHPPTLRVDAGREIGWVNQTGRGVRVQFEPEVAREMVCREGSGFRLNGDVLESPEIRVNQFASMCSLSPGVYAYRVQFSRARGGEGAPGSGRILQGRLVVE
jgi:hypothetical protein